MWSLLKSAVDGFFRHKTARLGAALAYYSVFSLGTLLLIVAAIAGFFFGVDAVRGSLTSQFRSLLGDTASQAVEAILKGAVRSRADAGQRLACTRGRPQWLTLWRPAPKPSSN